MKPVAIADNIYWIGAVDFNKRNFHGYSRSPEGTTYNSFVITDEKNVVFDTVDSHYEGTMFCRLAKVLPLEKVDYIVVNHTEKDHAGALPELVARCKPEKIITSAMGKKFMQAQFNTEGWPIETVKTGDVINIGKRNIHFIEMRMLHWPDSMASYIPEDKLLISNDAFGQNIASSERFSTQLEREHMLRAVQEYYYNIVLPFSPQVIRTLDAVATLKLDIETIAPDHGLIWKGKDEVNFVLNTYRELAEQKPQARALVAFDSMWDSTARMASAIASGLEDAGVPTRIIDMRVNHHSDVMTEMSRCGAVIIGSPTHNNNVLPSMADLLTYMKGLRPQNRVGGAFGSYAWSGEAVTIIQDTLGSMGMDMPAAPVKVCFVPKHEALAECHQLGKTVAEALLLKCAS